MAYLDSVDILRLSGWVDVEPDFGRGAAAAPADLCRLC